MTEGLTGCLTRLSVTSSRKKGVKTKDVAQCSGLLNHESPSSPKLWESKGLLMTSCLLLATILAKEHEIVKAATQALSLRFMLVPTPCKPY